MNKTEKDSECYHFQIELTQKHLDKMQGLLKAKIRKQTQANANANGYILVLMVKFWTQPENRNGTNSRLHFVNSYSRRWKGNVTKSGKRNLGKILIIVLKADDLQAHREKKVC